MTCDNCGREFPLDELFEETMIGPGYYLCKQVCNRLRMSDKGLFDVAKAFRALRRVEALEEMAGATADHGEALTIDRRSGQIEINGWLDGPQHDGVTLRGSGILDALEAVLGEEDQVDA